MVLAEGAGGIHAPLGYVGLDCLRLPFGGRCDYRCGYRRSVVARPGRSCATFFHGAFWGFAPLLERHRTARAQYEKLQAEMNELAKEWIAAKEDPDRIKQAEEKRDRLNPPLREAQSE